MKKLVGLCLALVLTSVFQVARAQTVAPLEADASLEARARRMEAELRCVVCQNQSLADSSASLAVDLRREIRQQLAAGATQAEIEQFLVRRYGEFVLYRPSFSSVTVALWMGPLALLVGGTVVLSIALRRQAGLARDAVGEPDRV